MPVRETHIAPPLASPVRLTDYLGGVFDAIPTRKGMKKAVDKGLVRVNSEIGSSGMWIRGGEVIELLEESSTRHAIFEHKLEVLYEDDHIAAINKPAGVETSGNKFKTIQNALPHNLEPTPLADALHRITPVHRLDFPTTGVMLVAKTHSALVTLSQAFEQGVVQKVYLAVAVGTMPNEGSIDQLIDGKASLTRFEVLSRIPSDKYHSLNLVEARPTTGRRHQIRRHLQSIGHPVLGDREYWPTHLPPASKGLYLHARSLNFRHPDTQSQIDLEAPLPTKFKRLFP